MTTKKQYEQQWKNSEPHERRARLNELGSNENKTDDEQNEHDALAGMVAVDEDTALNEVTKVHDE